VRVSSVFAEIPPLIRKRKPHPLIVNMRQYRSLYVMSGIGVAWFVIFRYAPMAGLAMAFQDFKIMNGIWGSDWTGLENFVRFFRDPYCLRILRNTFLLAFYSLLVGFPPPIILALLLNEMRNERFKRIAQSISYLPHFVSTVVVVGMLQMLTASDGIINNLLVTPFGGKPILFMSRPEWFRALYVGSSVWQEVGWGSIIYLAAISGIDPELYEAARIDGTSRLQAMLHITLPLIMPTIKVLLVLRMGQLLNVGFEKAYLLSSPATYETSDVIATYVYRVGIASGHDFGYAAAIGLFESLLALFLVVGANFVSKRASGEGVY
jgi:putative aldouronate transport system permease protein